MKDAKNSFTNTNSASFFAIHFFSFHLQNKEKKKTELNTPERRSKGKWAWKVEKYTNQRKWTIKTIEGTKDYWEMVEFIDEFSFVALIKIYWIDIGFWCAVRCGAIHRNGPIQCMVLSDERSVYVCFVFCISFVIWAIFWHSARTKLLRFAYNHRYHSVLCSFSFLFLCSWIVMTCTWARCLFFIVIVSYMAFSVESMNQFNRNDKNAKIKRWMQSETQPLPKRGNKIKIENIQTKMSQTVANRAFYCTIISFEIRQHQFWGTPFWSIKHTNANTRRRNNATLKNTEQSLLLLLRWEYKYFFA